MDCCQIKNEFGLITIYPPDQLPSGVDEERLYSALVQCLLTKPPVQEVFKEIPVTKKAVKKRTTDQIGLMSVQSTK